MSAPLVSVVTPFYNSAEYLDECIRSVLRQSFTDFEYVLLDNCSTDGSTEIARRHAAQDARIRYVRNVQFLGQVPNYNAALALISPGSAYCKIVQADDWLYRQCLEEMVGLARGHPRVGIVSSYRLAGAQVKEIGLAHTESVVPGREACRRQLLRGIHLVGSPTTILMRSDLVRARRPFYAEGRLHEDTEACYELLGQSDLGFVHQILSFTRTDNESTMSRVRSFNPALLDKLILVHRYGAACLDTDELRGCWQAYERRYLRLLADALVSRRPREFWRYHHRGMASIGYRLPHFRLAGYVLGVLLEMLLNPLNTAMRVMSFLKRRLDRRASA